MGRPGYSAPTLARHLRNLLAIPTAEVLTSPTLAAVWDAKAPDE
jgi:hypothetical protein